MPRTNHQTHFYQISNKLNTTIYDAAMISLLFSVLLIRFGGCLFLLVILVINEVLVGHIVFTLIKNMREN